MTNQMQLDRSITLAATLALVQIPVRETPGEARGRIAFIQSVAGIEAAYQQYKHRTDAEMLAVISKVWKHYKIRAIKHCLMREIGLQEITASVMENGIKPLAEGMFG